MQHPTPQRRPGYLRPVLRETLGPSKSVFLVCPRTVDGAAWRKPQNTHYPQNSTVGTSEPKTGSQMHLFRSATALLTNIPDALTSVAKDSGDTDTHTHTACATDWSVEVLCTFCLSMYDMQAAAEDSRRVL